MAISVIARNHVRSYARPVATVGENIKRMRKKSGIQQGELAERIGVSQSVLSSWETDRYALPETASLLKLAKALECSVDDLLAGVDEQYDRTRASLAAHVVRERVSEWNDVEPGYVDVGDYTKDDIPVIAEGEASPQGTLFWDDEGKLKSDVEDRISRPRDLTDPRAYGVKVRGDSMLPIYKAGMTLIVSPNVTPRDGDEVYVQLLSGERLLKIVRRVADGYLLESANPAYEPRFVKREEVGAMHPIIYARRRR